MRRRRLVLVAAFAAPFAWLAACSFPSPSIVPDLDAEGTDGAGDSATTDARSDADAGEGGFVLPPDVDPEGGAHDATTVPDATIPRPEAGVDAGPDACCDCDDDKHRSETCPNGIKGDDCDDYNAGIFTGQDFVSSPWDTSSPHTPAGDWNCDGTTTKQYPYNVSCGLVGDCSAQGFSGNPDCGASGQYVYCKGTGLPVGALCTEDTTKRETRTQGCR